MDHDFSFPVAAPSDEVLEMVSSFVSHENDASTMTVEHGEQILDRETDANGQYLNSGSSASDAIDSVLELNKLKLEMKMMETALQGSAGQAQAKADEIAKMMNENGHLKAVIEDLKQRKSPDAEVESLREEYHQRVATLERKESMESICDSLAEELVKMTAQCEKLQAESALLPGIWAELEALRRWHSAALELMGEHDEELEELRADIVDVKEMYREQVDLLVNKIQIMSSSMGNAG